MILRKEERSEFFGTLAWMGLTSTEEYQIRKSRLRDSEDVYEELTLSDSDVDRVGYLYPHVVMNLAYEGTTELWIGNRYLNPKALTWISTTYELYAILDQRYDIETEKVLCQNNPGIVYRFTNISDSDDKLAHTITIDTTQAPYMEIKNLEHSAYYISQDKYHIPKVKRDGTKITFIAPYRHDIDFFICSNLANVVRASAGKGMYVDQLYSTNCYHRILVDHDPNYPFDARFYPCICVDKDCVIRVYNDRYHTILYPGVSRLLAYPEFLDIADPYNTDNEYLNSLKPVDQLILASDSDEEVIQKFSEISAYCYRLWERYPYDTSEIANFIICDNSTYGRATFKIEEISFTDQKESVIYTNTPFEEYRDIIFYEGMVFSDYTVRKLKRVRGEIIEDPSGQPTYIIDTKYDPDKLTLIKFNTDRDTNFVNIGEYINEENIARLHIKLNRFYRNLLVLRTQVIDDTGDYARIATVQPNTTDEYIWYELLTNTVPEMFETNPITQIGLYGLSPDNIPEDIRKGAYMLNLDAGDGPASYQDILTTYFKLARNRKEYLALQYGKGVDDPRVQSVTELGIGNPEDVEHLNALAIDDPDTDPTVIRSKYEEGFPEIPYTEPHNQGDLYFKHKELATPPPEEENIDITEISMGPQEPEGDDHKLWIDTEGEELPGLITGDMYDSKTDHVTFTGDSDQLDASSGDYAFENPEIGTDEDVAIDELLSQLDDSDDSDIAAGQLAIEPVLTGYDAERAADNINNLISTIDEDGEGTFNAIVELTDEEKLEIVHHLITDDNEPEDAIEGDLWIQYLIHTPAGVLNMVVYKILLAAHVNDIENINYGNIALEGDDLPREDDTVILGNFPRWTKEKQLLIQPHPIDEETGNARPEPYTVREHNFKCIMSYYEPDAVIGDLWINVPAVVLEDIIKDIISSALLEVGEKMPEGFYDDAGYDTLATMVFDYHPHDKDTEGLGELFKERIDESLHPVHYGKTINEDDLKEDDLWYEFIDEIEGIVAYSDENCMVLKVNERLMMVEFDNDNVTAFAFDDVFMNFRGTLGIRYLSVIADLIRSGELTLKDIDIFYTRLITNDDDFDPDLRRLYIGTSCVISTLNVDPCDYAILYSSNIGRFRMDYSDPRVTNRERGHAYRMCIDLTQREFNFLYGKMLLFVNGKYIHLTEYTETTPGRIQLKSFNEIIAMVDIFYDTKDVNLMALKGCSAKHINIPDDCVSIQRPSKYETMEPIEVHDHTYRGFYDVLLQEFIFNGKLLRILNYLIDHPEEYEDYRRELIQHFHTISDIDLCGMDDRTAKIVISGECPNTYHYEINEGGE